MLVGPATRRRAEGIFDWGPSEDVLVSPGSRALSGSYLLAPRPRSAAEAGRRRLAAGRPARRPGPELEVLTEAVRATVSSGRGQAVVIVGEPGLGKTRLVGECRKYFMGWVGAGSGRLPLWLEGRCASYASSTPYGAYQQLLCRFIGAPLEAGPAVLRPALESAVRAVFSEASGAVLARMVGITGPRWMPTWRATNGGASAGDVHGGTFASGQARFSRPNRVLALEDLHSVDPTLALCPFDGRACLSGFEWSAPFYWGRAGRSPTQASAKWKLRWATALGVPCGYLAWFPLKGPTNEPWRRFLVPGDIGDQALDAICEGVDGNPLFLEERVASLLDTGALTRRCRLATGPGRYHACARGAREVDPLSCRPPKCSGP